MDFTRQSPRASDQHSTFLADKSKTCIDCHKGIAHRLPNPQHTSAVDDDSPAGPAALSGLAEAVAAATRLQR